MTLMLKCLWDGSIARSGKATGLHDQLKVTSNPTSYYRKAPKVAYDAQGKPSDLRARQPGVVYFLIKSTSKNDSVVEVDIGTARFLLYDDELDSIEEFPFDVDA